MEYSIRPIGPQDAEGFNALRRMPGVFENTLGLPSERVKRNQDGIASLGPDDHNFVAVTPDGTVIGVVGLKVRPQLRMRHTADVGIFVHTDWQGKGVGTALMQTVLDLADNWLMLVRVELDAFPDNAAAIHLYEKLGFEREGMLRKAAIRNGRYEDLVMMSRIRPTSDRP